MTDLDKYLKMLKSPKANTRYDACEELRVANESSPEIILALEEATRDENEGVAERARKALDAEAHQQMALKMGKLELLKQPESIEQDSSITNEETWGNMKGAVIRLPNALYRIGGIAAFASAVLYLVNFFGGGSYDNTYLAYILSFIIAIGVLMLTFLPHNLELAILAFVVLGGTTIWRWFVPIMMDVVGSPRINQDYGATVIFSGLGFLLFGGLQYGGGARAAGILALVTGALSVLLGVIWGNHFLVLLLFPISILLVIWLIVMGWGLLRTRGASQSGAA